MTLSLSTPQQGFFKNKQNLLSLAGILSIEILGAIFLKTPLGFFTVLFTCIFTLKFLVGGFDFAAEKHAAAHHNTDKINLPHRIEKIFMFMARTFLWFLEVLGYGALSVKTAILLRLQSELIALGLGLISMAVLWLCARYLSKNLFLSFIRSQFYSRCESFLSKGFNFLNKSSTHG